MSEDINKNMPDIDSFIDEFLANEETTMQQTMIDFSGVENSTKDTAKSTLFTTDPKRDIEYINSALTNSNFPSGTKAPKKQPEIITTQEKKEDKEFQMFDEEINYRKKLEKIMKRSTPTEPFAMDVVKDENIPAPIGEDPAIPSAETENEFEYFSHDQMGKFDKISVRTYSSEQKSSGYSPYLLANKLLFMAVLCAFAIYAVELAIFFLFFKTAIAMGSVYYLTLLLIACIPFGFAGYKYLSNPNLKVKNKINFLNMALNSIIVVVLAVVVILIITLLTSASVLDFSDLLPKIVIPIVLLCNYPIGILIYFLLYRSERFFE